jgi:hypothetical protein
MQTATQTVTQTAMQTAMQTVTQTAMQTATQTAAERTPLKSVPGNQGLKARLATDVALQILARRARMRKAVTAHRAEGHASARLYPSLATIAAAGNWYLLCDEHRAAPSPYQLVTGEVSHWRVCGVCTLRLSFDKSTYACAECGAPGFVCPHGRRPRKHLCAACAKSGKGGELEPTCRWCGLERLNCFVVKSLDYFSAQRRPGVPAYVCTKDVIQTTFKSDEHVRDAYRAVKGYAKTFIELAGFVAWIASQIGCV